MNTPETAIGRAVAAIGSQNKLAKLLGVTQPTVWRWLRDGEVPPLRVLDVERVSGVSRHDLRPDLYPRD